MSPNPGKILDLTRLRAISESLKQKNKRVVLCHGTFDLLHIGHIRHLKQAAKLGDTLIVTLTADKFVNKGPDRPIFNQALRAEHIAAIDIVDYVALVHDATAIPAIDAIKPDIYFKGSEYKNAQDDLTGNIERERKALQAHGGCLEFSDGIVFSSSKLLNNYFEIYPPDTLRYLDSFSQRFGINDVIGALDQLSSLNLLVIGDAIIDEYHYTSHLGQSGKYNVPTVRFRQVEKFAGGAMAVANHCAALAGSVRLFSALGDSDNQEGYIRDKLRDKVQPHFVYYPNSPTLTKKRFVDEDMNKLFEVYEFGEGHNHPHLQAESMAWMHEHLNKFDAVVVSDFGNGFISDKMAELIAEKARFIAVNTQVNSENRGYHVITRYPRADFVSLNEPELRLAMHDRKGSIEEISEKLGEQVKASFVGVTKGPRGIHFLDRVRQKTHHIPALSTKVVDRIGAGDTFLSVAGCSLAAGLDAEIAGFSGAAAAAMNVQVVCNSESISKSPLYKFVSTLLNR